MNTKNFIYWIQLIIYSVLLAFIIPIIFEWIHTRSLEITTRGIEDALFFGILIPFMIFLSKNVKNDFFNVFIALLVIFTLFLILRIGYLF
jgi:hypothetical protein